MKRQQHTRNVNRLNLDIEIKLKKHVVRFMLSWKHGLTLLTDIQLACTIGITISLALKKSQSNTSGDWLTVATNEKILIYRTKLPIVKNAIAWNEKNFKVKLVCTTASKQKAGL